MKIVQIPNKVLITPVEAITTFDSKLKKLIVDMEETLIACVDPQGVGLAAPQVGISQSLFITKPSPDEDTRAFINPVILELDETWPPQPKPKKKKKDSKETK